MQPSRPQLSTTYLPITDAADGWMPFLPAGEYPFLYELDGEEIPILQIVAAADLPAIAARFTQGQELLWDYEHRSLEEEGDTTAAAWITDLKVEGDTLFAQVRWTVKGRADVTGGNYRKYSPVLALARAPRPGETGARIPVTAVVSSTLTNRPNIRTLPILANKAPLTLSTPMNLKAILLALGLAETATEADALKAIEDLKAKTAAAENKATTEAAAAKDAANKAKKLEDALIEHDIAEFEPVIANKESIRAALQKDRDGTRALLAGMKAPQPAAPIHAPNKSRLGQPAPATANNTELQNAAVAKIRAANPGLSFTGAWAQAKIENPSLFQA